VTSDGTTLSADAVVGLAGEADVDPTVVSTTGVVLQLGRTRRLASCGQTIALVARDGGCSFPGCDRPPEWCQRHHTRAWIDGGKTDLQNLLFTLERAPVDHRSGGPSGRVEACVVTAAH
jgi:hypothetical protein